MYFVCNQSNAFLEVQIEIQITIQFYAQIREVTNMFNFGIF